MKYLNQINLLLMLLGCVIVAYAFSATFLQQELAVPRNIDVPQFGTQPLGSESGSPLMRRSTTTATSAVERIAPRRTQRKRPGGLKEFSTPGAVPAAEGTEWLRGAEVRSEEERPQGPAKRQVGERRRAVTANRRATEDTSAPSTARPSNETEPGAGTVAPRSQPANPASSVEGQKRNERRNPPPPATRSSLMGRRPQ